MCRRSLDSDHCTTRLRLSRTSYPAPANLPISALSSPLACTPAPGSPEIFQQGGECPCTKRQNPEHPGVWALLRLCLRLPGTG